MVSLAEARKARDDARELIRQGRHPAHAWQTERTRQINANALTFKAIAEEWIEKKRSRWAPYYLRLVERGTKKDIYPRIGRLPIRSVTAADVLAILDRATKRGAEVVALNLRQWRSQVFRYAVTLCLRCSAPHVRADRPRGSPAVAAVPPAGSVILKNGNGLIRPVRGFPRGTGWVMAPASGAGGIGSQVGPAAVDRSGLRAFAAPSTRNGWRDAARGIRRRHG